MWKCKRCKKPVYFAERRQSMGFDWHRQCLKCEECGKILNTGQHAEHKETPYCNIPCYSALFGPKLFGHGSTVESHQSFGKRAGKLMLKEKELEKQIQDYNDHMENNGASRLVLTSRVVNFKLVFEGVLRVFWGIHHSIRVKEEHDQRPIIMRRKSSKGAIKAKEEPSNFFRHSVHQFGHSKEFHAENVQENRAEEIVAKSILVRTLSDSKLDAILCNQEGLSVDDNNEYGNSSRKTLPSNLAKRNPSFLKCRLDRFETSLDLPQENQVKLKKDSKVFAGSDDLTVAPPESSDSTTIESNKEEEVKEQENPGRKNQAPRALRRRHGRKYDKSILKRKSSFNGHWYDRDSSVFTPPKNSIMSIWATSVLSTKEVLKMILEKYQIQSEEQNYGLFLVKDTGERRIVAENEIPLLLRVKLGPHEDVVKFQLMEINRTNEIRQEVAQFLRFTYAECRAILDMFYEEEEREIEQIRRKYTLMKRCIINLLARRKNENKELL